MCESQPLCPCVAIAEAVVGLSALGCAGLEPPKLASKCQTLQPAGSR